MDELARGLVPPRGLLVRGADPRQHQGSGVGLQIGLGDVEPQRSYDTAVTLSGEDDRHRLERLQLDHHDPAVFGANPPHDTKGAGGSQTDRAPDQATWCHTDDHDSTDRRGGDRPPVAESGCGDVVDEGTGRARGEQCSADHGRRSCIRDPGLRPTAGHEYAERSCQQRGESSQAASRRPHAHLVRPPCFAAAATRTSTLERTAEFPHCWDASPARRCGPASGPITCEHPCTTDTFLPAETPSSVRHEQGLRHAETTMLVLGVPAGPGGIAGQGCADSCGTGSEDVAATGESPQEIWRRGRQRHRRHEMRPASWRSVGSRLTRGRFDQRVSRGFPRLGGGGCSRAPRAGATTSRSGSSSSTPRRRVTASGRAPERAASRGACRGVRDSLRLVESAEWRWRAVNAPHLVVLVRAPGSRS